jgi:hypothetical protein
VAALAEIGDVEDRLGRDLAPTEVRQAQAALNDASAVVRNYTRRSFTREQTTQRLRPVGGRVSLPQRPVVSIETVVVIGDVGQRITLPAWTWDGGNELWIYSDSGQIINLSESLADLFLYRTPIVEVTYTHGFTEIPGDIVAVVAGKAAAILSLPASSGGGVVSAQAADTYSYQLAGFARSGPLSFSDADRQILNTYRRGGTTIELRG